MVSDALKNYMLENMLRTQRNLFSQELAAYTVAEALRYHNLQTQFSHVHRLAFILFMNAKR